MNTGLKAGLRGKFYNVFSKKKLLIFILAIVVGVSGFFVVRGMVMKASAKDNIELRTAVARRGNISVTVTGSGPAASSSKKDVTASVSATFLKAYYKDGDEVKAGDLLFELDDSTYQANVRQIELNLSQARLTYEKVQKEIANLNMVAPFSGRVTSISVKEGDSVSSNTAVLTLIDESKLKITLPFRNTAIEKIQIGERASVYLKDTMEVVYGTVTYVEEKPYSMTNGGLACNVEITLDNPGALEEGIIASAQIETGGDAISSLESGTLVYINKTVMKAETSGTVKEIPVRDGQFVNSGTTLVVFENDELILNRESNSLKVNDLEKQLEEARKQLGNCKIYAPIDGVIIDQKELVEGDQVKIGEVLCSVINLNNIEFEISVDELDIPRIAVGQKVDVTVDAIAENSGQSFTGVVKKIASQGSTQGGVTTYPVTIEISDPKGIKEGMNCNASIFVIEKNNILYIPIEAVTNIGGRAMVFVRNDGQLQQSAVVPGDFMQGNQGNWGSRRGLQGSNQGSSQANNQGGSEASSQESNVEERSTDSRFANRIANQNPNQAFNSSDNQNDNQNDQNNVRSNNRTGEGASALMENFLRRNTTLDPRIADYYKDAVPVFIQTGVNNETYIEVVSGLQEGDEVILPPIFQSQNSSGSKTTNPMGGFGGFGGFGGGSTVVPGGTGGTGGRNFQVPNVRDNQGSGTRTN
ncbi:MAG: HlyD family efflux transporter periplasmic adaptor subunit [Firmicutes bacterium]|nr:HlyD family efflux transporter periplasmic adaptor subunit [Bacillota bacterium]